MGLQRVDTTECLSSSSSTARPLHSGPVSSMDPGTTVHTHSQNTDPTSRTALLRTVAKPGIGDVNILVSHEIKASPRNLHFLYSRSNRKFSWNTSLKQASSTMKKWPHWVVYASLILREIRVYSTGISSWFSDRPTSCPPALPCNLGRLHKNKPCSITPLTQTACGFKHFEG